VAFDRTNLKAVALIVRKLHPKARIVIAADNAASPLEIPA
jgi:phage/plasmid primase-like uncharacterized protein